VGWWQEFRYVLRQLDRRRAEEELREEIRAHLELETEQNIEAGMSPEEARFAALRAFGNVTLSKEDSRTMWGLRGLETLWQDVRFSARTLLKNPTFTIVAVIALALGIGANSAIFSVVNTVLLSPLPYKDPERLVMVWEKGTLEGSPINSVSAANFMDWREQNQVFEGMAILLWQNFNLTGVGEPERIEGRRVSANLFQLLGVEPQPLIAVAINRTTNNSRGHSIFFFARFMTLCRPVRHFVMERLISRAGTRHKLFTFKCPVLNPGMARAA
jgi:hypothetical protein